MLWKSWRYCSSDVEFLGYEFRAKDIRGYWIIHIGLSIWSSLWENSGGTEEETDSFSEILRRQESQVKTIENGY